MRKSTKRCICSFDFKLTHNTELWTYTIKKKINRQSLNQLHIDLKMFPSF